MKTVISVPGILLIMWCFVITGVYGQCIPHSPFVPWKQTMGDLLCPDLTAPTDVTLLELKIDGVVCSLPNYEFTYPYAIPGYYRLLFDVDESVDHVLNVCVRGLCGSEYYTGGFSDDGITPADCTAETLFTAYSPAKLAPIILKDPESKISTDTHILHILLLFGLSFVILVMSRVIGFSP